MARLPIPIQPTGIVPPSQICEDCTIGRLEAVESNARKRGARKRPASPPQPASDAVPKDSAGE